MGMRRGGGGGWCWDCSVSSASALLALRMPDACDPSVDSAGVTLLHVHRACVIEVPQQPDHWSQHSCFAWHCLYKCHLQLPLCLQGADAQAGLASCTRSSFSMWSSGRGLGQQRQLTHSSSMQLDRRQRDDAQQPLLVGLRKLDMAPPSVALPLLIPWPLGCLRRRWAGRRCVPAILAGSARQALHLQTILPQQRGGGGGRDAGMQLPVPTKPLCRSVGSAVWNARSSGHIADQESMAACTEQLTPQAAGQVSQVDWPRPMPPCMSASQMKLLVSVHDLDPPQRGCSSPHAACLTCRGTPQGPAGRRARCPSEWTAGVCMGACRPKLGKPACGLLT